MANPGPHDADAPEVAIAALRALGQLPPTRPLLQHDDLTLTLSPREEGLAAKDVPVDVLAKKVIGVRDKLRVLEQRVNSSEISAAEKIAVEHRVTALYDSLAGLMAFFSEDAFGGSGPTDGAGSNVTSSDATGPEGNPS